MLAGSRLDVISSDCNAYYVARLEHLTSSLPSSLSAAQQLLPKEASTVAQFLYSASQSVLLPHNQCFGNHTRLHVQYIIKFHMSCFSFTVHTGLLSAQIYFSTQTIHRSVYVRTHVHHIMCSTCKPVHVLCVCGYILCSFY